MASIQKRNNSYRIKVSCGYGADGKQIQKFMTWKPDPSLTPKQIEKELQRQAVLFEESCKLGQATGSAVKFEPFAKQWYRECAEINLKRQKNLVPRASLIPPRQSRFVSILFRRFSSMLSV